MTVRVILPGALQEYADGLAELAVPLDGAAPLADVLDGALGGWPLLSARIRDETGSLRRHVNVFVDGRNCRDDGGLACAVGPSSVVHVIPAVSGG